MGVLAAAVLAASKRPICATILQLPPAVAEAAAPFWWLRIALLPVSLWNMACSGILQVGCVPPGLGSCRALRCDIL